MVVPGWYVPVAGLGWAGLHLTWLAKDLLGFGPRGEGGFIMHRFWSAYPMRSFDESLARLSHARSRCWATQCEVKMSTT